jgi:hypothetical protein
MGTPEDRAQRWVTETGAEPPIPTVALTSPVRGSISPSLRGCERMHSNGEAAHMTCTRQLTGRLEPRQQTATAYVSAPFAARLRIGCIPSLSARE